MKATSMTLGLFVFALGSPGQAWAANLPSGATVVHGTVDLQQQGNDALRILQGSQSAIVNWQSFDIGAGALVDIVQPNIDSALLSRIVGGNPSEILGSLNANGHLFLVNPNGIIFGKDSTVDVHALIASTLDIADSAFLSGNISFTGDSEAAVINLGSINAESFAALIGGKVSNAGSIISRGGDAALLAADAILEVGEASGGKITLDLSGLLGGTADNSGSIDVASSTTQGGGATILGEQVAVSGTVDASGATGGGLVRIGGDYQGQNANLSNAQTTNISGTISADSSLNGDGGRVIIWADGVTTFIGDLSATGSGSGSGGFAEVSGKNILNFEGSVDLSSASGVSGTLLLDPTNITIKDVVSHTSITGSTTLEPSAAAGSVISLSTLNTALASSNVIIQTSAGGGSETGNISVDSGLAITGSNDLTITADGDITMISGSINLGSGDLSVTAGNTRTDGTILLFSSITVGDLVLVADDAIQVTGAVDVSNGGGTISGTVSQTAGSVTINNITTPATISSSTNNGNVTIQGSGNLSINSITAGTAQVSVTSTAGSVIDHASDTTADITADTVILSAATGLGSSAAIELASAISISASSTGSGNIDIDHVADASTSITTIVQTGTGNILFDQTGSQALAITNNATAAAGNLTLTTDGTFALASTSVTGDMSLTSSGAITDTGTITVSGTTTLASGAANDITFDTASNNFGTVITTNGNNVILVDTNAIALGASTVSGNFGVTAGGAITDSGILAVTGTSSFTAGANAITLDSANDFTGAVSLSNTGSNNVIIDDANNLTLGTVTVGGNFTVDNVGTITQSGVVTVSGNTVLDNQDGTDASITLTNAANAFTGTVTFTTDTGSNVSLTDTTALDLQSGLSINDLTIEAGGAITQSGALTVAGDSSFTAGANAITLTQAANDFTGAVSLSNSGTNDVGVTDANAIDLGTIGVGQNLAVTASGAITDTGVLTIGGTSTFDNSGGSNAAIDLGSSSTFTGNVTFTTDAGSDVTINDSTAFVIQSGLNVNNLNLTAGGAVTDAGNIDIDGTLTVSATGQTVALGGTGNDLTGNVTLTGGAVTLVDTTATAIAGITATGALSVTSGGAITQSGVITNDGQIAVLNAGTNAITLNQ
ncbi:MAG: filamentous hemagglutinin N-terminal domain-containing protein, partial [Verrucomicrobia bacterium]|nr:filamentous hemagglutinin N-terminal domain-containing protein [Verrucomicrobiota bacterium]